MTAVPSQVVALDRDEQAVLSQYLGYDCEAVGSVFAAADGDLASMAEAIEAAQNLYNALRGVESGEVAVDGKLAASIKTWRDEVAEMVAGDQRNLERWRAGDRDYGWDGADTEAIYREQIARYGQQVAALESIVAKIEVAA